MKQRAFLAIAAFAASIAAARADETAARHLRYAVTARLGADVRPASIDVDFTGWTEQRGMRLAIDERVRGDDLGAVAVTIERSGALRGDLAALTFEEETVLGLLALEVENMSGVSVGDAWDRSGDLREGTHLTHYAVRRAAAAGDAVELDVSRTIALPDGSNGFWRGSVRYDIAGVVPTAINVRGEVAQHPIALRADLMADTFSR